MSFTLWQSVYPLGQWAAKKFKRAYTAVSDFAPGHEAEEAFIKGFKDGGGEIIDSVRIPLANPDFVPYMQRVKDAKPDVLFAFNPAGKQATAMMKAYADLGLDKVLVYKLDAAKSTITPNDPPVLIVHGDSDRNVPYDQAVRLDAALRAAGVPSYFVTIRHAGHGGFGDIADGRIQPGEQVAQFYETRRGEMAATKEVPFARYYGSVDSTPLFVMLAGAYLDRTNDLSFASRIWPNVKAALQWMDHYGDRDGDGFIEYEKRSTNGLVQQGWKDSYDSVFCSDGSIAEPPIALCEVQGYAYAAKQAGARLAAA